MNSYDGLDDSQLVSSYIRGDLGAFGVLVSRHSDGMARFLFRMLGSREDVEDLCQEAFLRAHQNIQGYDSSKSSFKTWVYNIARRKAIDSIRKMETRRTVSGKHMGFSGIGETDEDLDPLQVLMDREEKDLRKKSLRDAIDSQVGCKGHEGLGLRLRGASPQAIYHFTAKSNLSRFTKKVAQETRRNYRAA